MGLFEPLMALNNEVSAFKLEVYELRRVRERERERIFENELNPSDPFIFVLCRAGACIVRVTRLHHIRSCKAQNNKEREVDIFENNVTQ